jgi:hypothetical protein
MAGMGGNDMKKHYLLFILFLFGCGSMFMGCNEKITDGQEDPYYLGSQGSCKYLPLNIDNKWNYHEVYETWDYDAYGELERSTKEESDLVNTVNAEPTDPLTNNYWGLSMVTDPLICWHNGMYKRYGLKTAYVIGDDIQVGDETDRLFLNNYYIQGHQPYVKEILDTYEVAAGVFHNVVHIEFEFSGSYEGMTGDYHDYYHKHEYWAEGVGLIYGYYYESHGQYNHGSTSSKTTEELTSYELH